MLNELERENLLRELPHAELAELRREVDRRNRRRVGRMIPARSLAEDCFDAAGGDFLGAVLLAVDRFTDSAAAARARAHGQLAPELAPPRPR